jgi:hypothetical protein
MKRSEFEQSNKRKMLALVLLLPWIAPCSRRAPINTKSELQQRFEGIGLILVVDAVMGAEMEQVIFYDDRGVEIYASARVARRNRGIMALGGSRVPITVRAVWREGAGWDTIREVWNEGIIVGDYTVPVAERIPDEVLKGIRAHGGGLRLKFRLKPNGVLFGWDIERAAPLGDISIFEMPGGDFVETRY